MSETETKDNQNLENPTSETIAQNSDEESIAEPILPKWVKIATLLSALVLLIIVGVAIRGVWAETIIHNPTTSSEGIIRQLYQAPDGHKEVRCAEVFDYPADKVWDVITDYKHFQDIFESRLWSMKVTSTDQDQDGKFHLVGEVNSKFGNWPIDVHITHSKTADKYVASWDQPFGKVLVNRGNWTITPIDQGKCLLVYTLETEVDPFPKFFTNTVLLAQSKQIIKAIEHRLKTLEK